MLARRLAETLEKNMLITTAHAQCCLREVDRDPTKRLTKILLEKGYIDERKLIEFFNQQYSMPIVDLSNLKIDPMLIGKLSPAFCTKHMILPIGVRDDSIVIATSDPTELSVFDQIRFQTKLRPEGVLALPSAIRQALEEQGEVSIEQLTKSLHEDAVEVEGGELDFDKDELQGEDAAHIIQFVTAVLVDAIRKKASDVHIEPYENDLRVRIRLDGHLVDSVKPPHQIRKPLIARIKVMAEMRLDEKRLPQEGRIRFKLPEGKAVDFRVSSVPTIHGEEIVIRILDKSAAVLGLDELGFESEDKERFLRAIKQPWGMCLATGATGSGKTTTLYGALNFLNNTDVKILTAEDPVEYNFAGINQVQMHNAIGLTFSSALRAFLRQDPDIILVGEIRDCETADIAMKAALTGHLVFSTLHTNDAVSTLARLKDLKVEPFLINSALSIVISQRLLRRICNNCRTRDTNFKKEDLIKLGFSEKILDKFTPMRGNGCVQCRQTGYSGRQAVYEVLEMSEKVRDAFSHGSSTDDLRRIAIAEGLCTLRMNAMKKVVRAETTIDELKMMGD